MTISKHTPGPWRVGIADWSDAGNARYELHGIKTISVADARLIAAAPDLLASLQRMLAQFESEIRNEYEGTSMLDERLAEADHASAAIAKATGIKE